jgi:hypothetical protein
MRQLLVLSILIIGSVVGTHEAGAYLQGLPVGRIAFMHEDTGAANPAQRVYNLRMMSTPNIGQQVPLTPFTLPGVVLSKPEWSKDFRQLAFAGNINNGLFSLETTSIYLINSDGSNLRQLTGFGVFGQLAGPTGAVRGRVVSGAGGSISGCIVIAQGMTKGEFCQSDGSFVLQNVPVNSAWVRAQATVTDQLGGPGLSIGFTTINVRQGQEIDAGVIQLQPQRVKSIEPTWSRVGAHIMVTSEVSGQSRQMNPNTGNLEWRPSDNQLLALWSVNMGFVQTVSLPGLPQFRLAGSDWSPVQDLIACAANGTSFGESYVVVMNPDGTNPVAIYQVPAFVFGPHYVVTQCRWSPDGRRIAFTRWNFSNVSSDIWVINADRTGLRQVTVAQSTEFAQNPSWSPDGQFLAFDASVSSDFLTIQRSDLFAINVATLGATRLTSDGRSCCPGWGR